MKLRRNRRNVPKDAFDSRRGATFALPFLIAFIVLWPHCYSMSVFPHNRAGSDQSVAALIERQHRCNLQASSRNWAKQRQILDQPEVAPGDRKSGIIGSAVFIVSPETMALK
uniref:Uncharacterized protein n=1 Tax=Anopheles coluzzii TaxID=1518534 RepID=A0A8W7PSM4_ANOCL